MPVTQDYLEEHLEKKDHVSEVACTYHGLLVTFEPGSEADPFGAMLREKGWAVDWVSQDRNMVHFVKVEGAPDAQADDSDESQLTIHLFVCADCGCVYCTDSKRHVVERDIDWHEHENAGAADDAVRMDPPCGCGCDLFNPKQAIEAGGED